MINGTLVAQIIHFFLAYLIIDKVFLKYAIAHVQKEDQIRSENMARIASLQEMNNQLNQKKIHQWNVFKHAFNERQPNIAQLDDQVRQPQSAQHQDAIPERDLQKLVDLVVEGVERGSTS